jgi:hypothetical protein
VDDRAIAGAFNGDQNKKLKLRKLTQDEIVVMAESGTNMSNAAEPIDAMSDSSIGGYDEPR